LGALFIWSQSKIRPGIRHYDVQVSENGGSWTDQ